MPESRQASMKADAVYNEAGTWKAYHYRFVIAPNVETVLLPRRGDRKYLAVQNLSAIAVYVSLDGAAAMNGFGNQVPTNGGVMEFSIVGSGISRDQVRAIHAGPGNVTLLVTEGRAD